MSQMPNLEIAEPPAEAAARTGPIALFLDFDGTLVEIAPRLTMSGSTGACRRLSTRCAGAWAGHWRSCPGGPSPCSTR